MTYNDQSAIVNPQGEGSKNAEAKKRDEELRSSLLAQILDQSAGARLSNIAMVNPEKAEMVKNYIIRMYSQNPMCPKVTDEKLVQLLNQISSHAPKPTVKFDRRRTAFDSDED